MGPLPGVIPGHGRGFGVRLGARGPHMPDACQGALAEGQFMWARGSWRSGVGCAALTEPEALAVHFEDVDVVGQAVEDGARQALRSEDLGPFVEGQVRGDDDRAALVALGDDLEQ